MKNMLLIDLLEATRDGQVFNIAKKHLRDKMDCLHDPAGDYCFFTPKKSQKVLPLLLVAHIDTVNLYGTKVKVYEDNGNLRNIHGILGADDRAGVYIILELIQKLDAVPYVLLTNHEEIGGIGVKSFCDANILDSYLKGINMFIEFDRRGVNQYVTYSPLPSKMGQFFEDYGYEKGNGSYSDVATLSRTYQIAHVNLSAGYFNEHSKYEYCSLSGVQFAIDNALQVLPLITEKVMVDNKPVTQYEDFNWQYSSKTKKVKKVQAKTTPKVVTKDKEYGTYEQWWEETYGAINGNAKEPTHHEDGMCPHCHGDEVEEVDYHYYICRACMSYIDYKDLYPELLSVGNC